MSRELLEQIKNFEEQEFAGVASRDTEFKPRLQPLNESGGSALLKIVCTHFGFCKCKNSFPIQQIIRSLFNFDVSYYVLSLLCMFLEMA